MLFLASCYFSERHWECFCRFWNVLLGIARFGIVLCCGSHPHGIAIVPPLVLFVCVSWRLGCWGLLVVPTLSRQLCCIGYIKTKGPLSLSCLSFSHTSIRIAGAVVFSALLLPLPSLPSSCRQPPFRPVLFFAVPRRWYCARYAKFLGSKRLHVCAVWPGNWKCVR